MNNVDPIIGLYVVIFFAIITPLLFWYMFSDWAEKGFVYCKKCKIKYSSQEATITYHHQQIFSEYAGWKCKKCHNELPNPIISWFLRLIYR